MTTPTTTEVSLLRSSPHETNLWMSIYKPPTVLACRVNNASAANGDMVITYDGVTAGSYGLVESGMTMYIGTSAGARDIGRIRVRSADATTITVAENSDVPWADDLYLTIVRFWEIDAIYPRIIQNTGTFETIWYKDYDIEYTDQNDNLGTFVCMGSHYAGFIDEGSCNVFYSATGTSNLLDETLTYDWFFQGATVTGSSALTPGNIAYDTAGHYTTRLKVTGDDSGVVDTSYRHISIYDRPENGTNHPILGWTFISMDGSREQGGYITRIKVRDDISDIVDGALVVIFADDWYGGTKQSIGGNALGRSTIVYVGYILDGSITYDYSTSSIEFEIGSPTEIMKLAEGFAVAVNSSTDPSGQAVSDENIPSGWVLVLNMNCERAIYHYLRWHSTVMFTTDFQFLGTDQNIEYFDADRESIYSAVDKLMRGTLQGNLVSDRQGKLWAEISVAATDGASGSFPTAMSLKRQDWMGTPTIDEAMTNELSYLELGGIAFDFAAGSTAYLSGAPGTAPSYRGRVERMQGMALTSQAQLNTLCGNLFAYRNAKYPNILMNMTGNYRHLDIAPQEIVSVSLESSDTPRKITWNEKPFHISDVSWMYDARGGFMHPSIGLHEVTQGNAGTSIDIPPMPPATGDDGGGFDIPPIYIPEFPTIEFPPSFLPQLVPPVYWRYTAENPISYGDYTMPIFGLGATYLVGRGYEGLDILYSNSVAHNIVLTVPGNYRCTPIIGHSSSYDVGNILLDGYAYLWPIGYTDDYLVYESFNGAPPYTVHTMVQETTLHPLTEFALDFTVTVPSLLYQNIRRYVNDDAKGNLDTLPDVDVLLYGWYVERLLT